MALSTYRGSFAWNQADAAGTNYDIDVGFVPKAVRVRITGASSATDAAGGGNVVRGEGSWTTGDIRRGATMVIADGQGNATTFIRHTDNAILTIPDTGTTGGTDSDGDLDVVAEGSWPTTTTIRFTVDTQLTAAFGSFRVMIEAFGGSDITDVKVGHFQEPASSGAQSQNVTDPGFQPTGMYLWTVGFATTPVGSAESAAQAMFAEGATDGTSSWVAFNGSDDNAANMDTRSYMKSGEVIAMGSEPAVTLDSRAGVTGFISTGITLDWTECAGLSRYIFYLAWRGGQTKVSSTTTRTDTTPFSGPTLGFTPDLLWAVSCSRAEDTADTPTDHAQMSVGSAKSTSDRGALACMDVDAAATSNCGHGVEYDALYLNLSTADPPAMQGLMDVTAWADPMTFVMDDADPSASFVGLLGIAANQSGVAPSIPAGALTVTGTVLSLAFTVGLGLGSLPVTGYAPTVFEAHNRAVPAGALTITGTAPALSSSVAVPSGALTVTGQAPTLSIAGMVIQIPAGSLSVQGRYVAVAFLDPAPGQLVITGYAPAIATSVGIPAGSLPITGQAPTIAGAGAIEVGAGSLLVTGLAPSLALSVALPAGSLAATGYAFTLAETRQIPAGSLVVEGLAPSMNGAFSATPGAGVLVVSGVAPILETGCAFQAGALVCQGYALSIGGAVGIPVGAVNVSGLLMTVSNSYVLLDPTAVRTLVMARTERVLEATS